MALSFIYRRMIPATLVCSSRSWTRSGRCGGRCHPPSPRQSSAAARLPPGLGRRVFAHTASRQQLQLVLPLTLGLIFLLLFVLYGNFKFPFITVLGVLLVGLFGAIVRFDHRHRFFSFLLIGFLALFGVSVLTAVVYISYVNGLRRDGIALEDAILAKAPAAAAPYHDDRIAASLGLRRRRWRRSRYRYSAAVLRWSSSAACSRGLRSASF